MWIEPYKNKYRAFERYTDPMTGKQKRVSTIIDKDTKSARKTAEEVLRAKIAEATTVMADADITLEELAEKYNQHVKESCRETTWKRDKSMVNGAIEILGKDVIAKNLTARYIDQKLRSTGKKNISLNTYLVTLKRMLKWAYRMEYLDDVSYLDRLPLYPDAEKKSRIEDKYLTSDDLKKLLESMQVEKWKLLTMFLALSGLRIGEALALKDADVSDYIHVTKTFHLTTGTVYDQPKTDCSVRDVYVQPELEDVVKKIRVYVLKEKLEAGHRSDLFLPDRDGGYVQYAAYEKYLKENSERILAHRITPHALRHTHVSLLAEQGYPLDAISRRVGHEDSKITKEIYLHITEKQKQKDNEQLRSIKIL